MKKVLFISHAVTIQHLIRPLLVAKQMKRRGHEVFFGLTDFRYEYLLKKENIPALKLSAIDRDKALQAVRDLRYNDREITRQFTEDLDSDLELIDKIKPDLLVNDMRFTAKMACILRGIPYAVIINAYYTAKLATRHTIPEAIFLSRLIPKPIQKIIFKSITDFMDYSLAGSIRRLAKARNITCIRKISQSLVSDSLNLIVDLPEFFPCKNLTKEFHYVGPFLWEPEIPIPEWFYKLDESKPIIYFTLGTSGSIQHLPQILEAFSNYGFQTILSCGGLEYRKELPKGVFMAEFLPALKILDRVNLVICHGGNGTIYQALSKGVPVIGLPTFFDQEWNSDRLQDLGLGKRISIYKFSEDKIIKAVKEIINCSEIKNNCLKFKEIILAYNAPKRCADLLEGKI